MSLNQPAYEQNLSVVKDLTPQSLWQWFARICATPHPSYHEEALANDIVAWASSRGMTAYRDGVGNVIIKKGASQGYEHHPTIALQAHLDMVPQANADTIHDFATDPIRLRIHPEDAEWLMATGTTLGADNGIGMASCLAVLDSDDIAHPPLEVLLTMTEETGMVGVFGLQPQTLFAQMMINTDTEEIGEVYIGCAGGIDADMSLKVDWQASTFDTAIDLTIKGLRGGHSGIDIHKNRGNAIKILARILADVQAQFADRFGISAITGGTLRNAIPREASVSIACQTTDKDAILAIIDQSIATITSEICQVEPKFTTVINDTNAPSQVLDTQSTAKAIHLMNILPSGVVRYSDVVADTVETSLSFGKAQLTADALECTLLIRSLIESGKAAVCQTLSSITTLAGADVKFDGDYVGWTPDTGSAITATTMRLYTDILGHAPEIKVIHAGLECGLIKTSHPTLDIVSIGPTIKNAHSPDEMVHIPSVATYWTLLTQILANVPKA